MDIIIYIYMILIITLILIFYYIITQKKYIENFEFKLLNTDNELYFNNIDNINKLYWYKLE